LGLFKNVQMQGAQKTEPRGVYGYTLSGSVCSATQQMSVFQQRRNNSLRLLARQDKNIRYKKEIFYGG
jgi:hypothetical protein